MHRQLWAAAAVGQLPMALLLTVVVQNNDFFSDSEEIEIEIDISKNFEGNQLSIYNFEIVKDFLFNKSYSDFLELFCNLRKEHDFIHFICLNNDVELKQVLFSYQIKIFQITLLNLILKIN